MNIYPTFYSTNHYFNDSTERRIALSCGKKVMLIMMIFIVWIVFIHLEQNTNSGKS